MDLSSAVLALLLAFALLCGTLVSQGPVVEWDTKLETCEIRERLSRG